VGLEEGLAATTAWYADDLLGANIAEVARSA
jgi:hypothetical protein